MVAPPPVVAARWPSRASASLSAPTIRPRTSAAVAEAHFGLGRMHVDVDLARVERDEQRQQRMAVARQIVGVGRAHRAEQKFVAHRPAVDEQILRQRIGARQRRQTGEAFEAYALALGLDGNGVGAEVGAEHVAEAGQLVVGRRPK